MIHVNKVREIGIGLPEWASRGIVTRGKMFKAHRVRPQSGIPQTRRLQTAGLASISVLLHDSGTKTPSSKPRSTLKDPMTYGVSEMKLQQHLLCLEKEKQGEGDPATPATPAQRRQLTRKKPVHHGGKKAKMWNWGETVWESPEVLDRLRSTRPLYILHSGTRRLTPYLYTALSPLLRITNCILFCLHMQERDGNQLELIKHTY